MSDSLERAAAVSLFVGDLSIFCTEDQIREFFSPFGKIDDVKIIRCETTQKNLCYGFVKFSAQESAAAAMKERNKTLLCGRPIRIRWAAHKVSALADMTSEEAKDPTASIHFTYLTNDTDTIITEEQLQVVFSQFGDVVDIIIKRYEIDQVNGWQRGYGFVHYSASLSGINASLSCVEALRDGVADGIHFKCSISHKLEVMLNERDIPFDRTKTAFTPIPRAAGASTQWTMALPAWGMAPSISSFPMCSAGSQTDSASEMGYALPPHYFQMPYFNMIPAWAYDPRRATQYITSGGVSFPPQYPAMHIPIPPPFIPMPIQHPVHRGQHWDNRQVDGAGSSGSTESMDTAADEHSVDHHRVVHGVPARNHPSSQTISHQAMSDNFKPNGHITPASAMQPLQQGASSERDAGMEPYHRRRSTHQ